ncbi:hypothetical protein Y695_03663 [Hydrogenophaga sp. T4]|nr:hypothetical protein Y695_03663 [Hydrogenophaga sp. T4]
MALVSACTTLAPKVVRFELLNPWVASVLGGFLIGFGLLALLRHQASVGGVNILAQWLQQAKGFSAGKVQMCVDLVVVLAAFWVLPPMQVRSRWWARWPSAPSLRSTTGRGGTWGCERCHTASTRPRCQGTLWR